MTEKELETIRYPVGRFAPTERLGPDERAEALDVLARAGDALASALSGLDDGQLDTRYREGGWTLRQVAHHVADSHVNGYVRVRWTLTEDEPVIKPYEQSDWAELVDARTAPVTLSQPLYESVNRRMVALFRSLDEASWARRFRHPEGGSGTVDTLLALYAWHARHHTAHVRGLRERRGW